MANCFFYEKKIANENLKYFRSHNAPAKINLADHLDIKIDNGIATISALSTDPLAQGKALLQYYAQGKSLNQAEKIIFKINNNNCQFLFFMAIFSLPEYFTQRAKPGTPIEVHFENKEAAAGIIDLLCTTDQGFFTPFNLKIPNQETYPVKYFAPKGTKAYLWRRTFRLQEIYNKYLKPQDDALLKIPNLKTKNTELFQAVKNRLKSFAEIRKFIKNNLAIVETKAALPKKTSQVRRSIPITNAEAAEIITGDSLLRTVSDETTYIFYSGKTSTLHFIDCGNPSSAADLEIILAEATRLNKPIKQLIIHQTHFHYDHVQNLPALLEMAEKFNLPVILDVPAATAQQIIGSMYINLEIFEKFLRARKLKINLLADSAYDNTGEVQLLPANPPELKHFINSRGYLYTDPEKKQRSLFTGDWNSFNKEQALKAFEKMFREFFENNQNENIKILNIFFEIGHFEEKQQEINKLLSELGRNYQYYVNNNLNIYFDHKKNIYESQNVITNDKYNNYSQYAN